MSFFDELRCACQMFIKVNLRNIQNIKRLHGNFFYRISLLYRTYLHNIYYELNVKLDRILWRIKLNFRKKKYLKVITHLIFILFL